MLEDNCIHLTSDEEEKNESIPLETTQARRDVDNSERPWLCKFCNFAFKNRNNMLEHLRFYHMKGQVPCNYCSRVFPTAKILRKHMQEHSLLAGRCPHCRNTLCKGKAVDRDSYIAHLDFCARKPMSTKGSLVNWDDFNSEEPLSWRCLKCCITFSDVKSYQKHVVSCLEDYSLPMQNIASSDGEERCTSEVSGKPFSSERRVYPNEPVSLEEESESLEFCVTEENKNVEFNMTEDNNFNYSCKQIGDGSLKDTDENLLIVDAIEVEGEEVNGEKPQATANDEYSVMYACIHCGKCFTELEERNRHKALCTRKNQSGTCSGTPATNDEYSVMYACTHCGKCFTELEEKNRHKALCTRKNPTGTHTLDLEKENVVIKRLCKYCKRTFSTKQLLKMHKLCCAERNTKDRISSCSGCNKSFGHKTILQKHIPFCKKMAQNKNEDVIDPAATRTITKICQFCNKQFQYIKNAEKHMTICKKRNNSEFMKKQNSASNETLLNLYSVRSKHLSNSITKKTLSKESTEKQWLCKYCFKSFLTRRLLRFHKAQCTIRFGNCRGVNSIPPMEIENVMAEFRWVCSYCATDFTDKFALHNHKRRCKKAAKAKMKNILSTDENNLQIGSKSPQITSHCSPLLDSLKKTLQLKCACGVYFYEVDAFKKHSAICGLKDRAIQSRFAVKKLQVNIRCNTCSVIFDSMDTFHYHLVGCGRSLLTSTSSQQTTKGVCHRHLRNRWCKRCGHMFGGRAEFGKHHCKRMMKHMTSCVVLLENIFPQKNCETFEPPEQHRYRANSSSDTTSEAPYTLPLEVVLEEQNDDLCLQVPEYPLSFIHVQENMLQSVFENIPQPAVIHIGKGHSMQSCSAPVKRTQGTFCEKGPRAGISANYTKSNIPSHNSNPATIPFMNDHTYMGSGIAAEEHLTYLQPNTQFMKPNKNGPSSATSNIPKLKPIPPLQLAPGLNFKKIATEVPPTSKQNMKTACIVLHPKGKDSSECHLKHIFGMFQSHVQSPKIPPGQVINTKNTSVEEADSRLELSCRSVDKIMECDGFVVGDKNKFICRHCFRSCNSENDIHLHISEEHKLNETPFKLYKMKYVKDSVAT